MKRIFDIDPWLITTHELNSENKRLQESMTSLGNEYMGMRGMFEETYSGDTHQGIYIGGVWFPDKTRVGWWKNGYPEYFGKAINALNFVKADIYIDDQKIDLARNPFSDFELSLDMKTGVLNRTFTVFGVQVKITRLVSAAMKELMVSHYEFMSLDGVAHRVRFDATIDADVTNEDANYDEQFWQVLAAGHEQQTAFMATQTMPNPFKVPQFTVVARQSFQGGTQQAAHETEKAVTDTFNIEVPAKGQASFEKRVIVTTSRDYDDLTATIAASQHLTETIQSTTYQELYQAHQDEWAQRWAKADIQIVGDDAAQQGIRFNLFQLFSTYYGNDPRLNIGPKGFTGEKYGGATYWDTEAFAIPVYLGVADPAVTRALLQYRFNQLEGAFHNAKMQGLKGALYPMVTFDGIESHNEWEITFEEIHRNADIPHAIAMYTEYTGDDSYVKNEGMDVLVGTARFWAARVHWSKWRNKYVMHGVTGPNEYENNVNNNWFTNTMARWLLKYTLERLPLATKEAQERVHVTEEEKEKWQDIVDKIYLPEDKELGIFLQQDDFLDKEIRPVSEIEDQRPINQHWSWDKILRSPFIKQADVLQGIYFFPENYTKDQKEKNFDFYEPLTVHESSLSPSIHSVLAAELGKKDKAVELYERTARLDLDNYNNDTVDGLHITSMSGSWLAIVQGFAGMRYDHDQLKFKPFIPDNWDHYSFKINYRGRLIKVYVDHQETKISLLEGKDLEILVNNKKVMLKEGESECLKD